ncbi:MAG: SURF1 family protein [Gammaproteobacteria bacterium]|nr:SURF1 family protein [Gammaproteobacteria bacterium]
MIKSAYRLEANWKVLLLVALLLPLLLRLGFWQLDRAEEKHDLQQMYEARRTLPPLLEDSLPGLNGSGKVEAMRDASELAFRRVKLSGRFDNAHSFLLDNQIANGRVGYHLLSPFISTSGAKYIINRGWIAGFADRRLPALPTVEGEQQLVASIYVPQGNAVLLGDDSWPAGWPTVVQQVDIEKMSQKLATVLFPYQLRVEPEQPGAALAYWPAISTRPEKHTGYAVQWFLMSIALLICALYASFAKTPTAGP